MAFLKAVRSSFPSVAAKLDVSNNFFTSTLSTLGEGRGGRGAKPSDLCLTKNWKAARGGAYSGFPPASSWPELD